MKAIAIILNLISAIIWTINYSVNNKYWIILIIIINLSIVFYLFFKQNKNEST